MSEAPDKTPAATPDSECHPDVAAASGKGGRKKKKKARAASAGDAPTIAVGEPAPSGSAIEPPLEGPYTLAIDIGGSGIKCMLLDKHGTPSGKRDRKETPRPATPEAVVAVIRSLLPDLPYDRVSVGFPGVVVNGVTRSAPNLHKTWAGFDLQQAVSSVTGRPVRVLNDAGLQGLGVIGGHGTEIVLTLGTGMGFALFVDGHYVPNIELAHHPLRKKETYEDYIGNPARLKAGNRRWTKRVLKVLAQILTTFNPTTVYLGGGNSAKLKLKSPLPDGVRITENIAGLLGGIALWR